MPTFLKPEQLDDLGRTILTLAKEVWVLKDRQRILEAVLEARGISVTEAVQSYQPDAVLEAELTAERQRFIQAIVDSLVPPSPPTPLPPGEGGPAA